MVKVRHVAAQSVGFLIRCSAPLMSLFTGESPVATNIEAIGQTEILEIRASAIKELLSRNRELAPAFSQNLAEHQPHSLRSTLQPQPPIEADAILERVNAFYGIGGASG